MSTVTFDELWPGVEDAPPHEATPLLVLADGLDDHDRPDFAFAFRWAAGRKARPFKRTDLVRPKWEWVCGGKRHKGLTRGQVKAREAAMIPLSVWEGQHWPNGTEWRLEFQSARAAYAWLADALKGLREDVSYPDLPPIVHRSPLVRLVTCDRCGLARAEAAAACPVCARAA